MGPCALVPRNNKTCHPAIALLSAQRPLPVAYARLDVFRTLDAVVDHVIVTVLLPKVERSSGHRACPLHRTCESRVVRTYASSDSHSVAGTRSLTRREGNGQGLQ